MFKDKAAGLNSLKNKIMFKNLQGKVGATKRILLDKAVGLTSDHPKALMETTSHKCSQK